MGAVYILLLLAAVVSNSLLSLALIRRPDRSATIVSFVVFLFTINLWALPQLFINLLSIRGDAFSQLDRFSALGYTFIPVSFLIFALSFSNKLESLKRLSSLSLVFVPSFLFLYLSLTTNLIDVHNYENIIHYSWGYTAPAGLLFGIFVLWFLAVIIYALLRIASLIRNNPDKLKRRQAILITLAMLVPVSVGSITDGIFPLLGTNILPLAVPLTSVMAIIIGFAIHKYELFEFSPLTILSNLGDGLITVDERGRVILINKSAEAMLGTKEKDVVGQLFVRKFRLLDQEGKAIQDKNRPLYLAMKNKKKMSFSNYYIMPKRGGKFSVAFTIAPLLKGKKVIGATVNFRDNSIEKEAEMNKDDFISIASHELKTPVTALKLYTQILEKQVGLGGSAKQLTSISKINNQADKLVSLVGDLLNVSRIQTGKFEYKEDIFSLEDLVKDSLESVKPIANKRQIIKQGAIRKNIKGDKEKLSQVLTNLITNAIKYSPEDKKIIVKSKVKNGDVIVSVKDFGAGISKIDQQKIFNRFYQGSSGRKNYGLGIGLYVSSEIVKSHNGELGVKSQKGKGSTFYFTLPTYKS